MALGYSGRGQYPVYGCADAKAEYGSATCQEVRAEAVDALVEAELLAALAPDQVALAMAALETLEQADHALEQQWQLRRERARYEAERAQRQYHLVEPEHRLVARVKTRLGVHRVFDSPVHYQPRNDTATVPDESWPPGRVAWQRAPGAHTVGFFLVP
jgi:hypothetical protein